VYVNGERIRRSFPTREEAEAALAALLADLEHDAAADLAAKIGPLTVRAVVEAYYDRRKPYLQLSTRARYESVLRKYVYPEIGHVPARDIEATPLLLEDWIGTIPPGQGRKALEVLGPAFRMAFDNGLIPSNPVAKVRRPRKADRKRKKEIPTPDDVEKIVIAAYETDVWWGYFVELVATLGLRRSEACALRWEDFVFPRKGEGHGLVHIRRAVGKRDGGIYIKPPKSGLERDVLVHPSLFEGLWYFDGETGWLFPGRDVSLRKDGSMPVRSTPGRLLVHLLDHGGEIACPQGRAGSDARRAIGTNSATFSTTCRLLEREGLVVRDVNARRTYRIALTTTGRVEAERLSQEDDVPFPVHPDTMGHRFEEMVEHLGLRGASGRPYSLHSLRHFRATHLYNASKDWVQVAKYLGHTSPAITMELYANNVVVPTQALLADSAVGLPLR
jgi:integrase